jgi:hypothetical protein
MLLFMAVTGAGTVRNNKPTVKCIDIKSNQYVFSWHVDDLYMIFHLTYHVLVVS